MKYTILGFSQEEMIKLNIDYVDALLLRYFVDFKDTKKMVSKIFENEKYYWVKYETVIEQYPILDIKKKDSVYRRFKKMVKAGVLIHKTQKQGGVYSYYALGPNYLRLIASDTNPNHTDLNPEPYGLESRRDTDLNPEPYGFKSRTKDSSIKDSSIKDNSSIKYPYSTIVDYLNLKAGTKYKSTSKKTKDLIAARFKEEFTLENFYKVIDNKSKEWRSTDMEKYLRPETIFGPKFESYLNQKNTTSNNAKNSNFNNFEQRTYDFEDLEKKLLGWDKD